MLEPHDHATLTLSRSEPAYGFQDVQQQCAALRMFLQEQWRGTRDLRAVEERLRAHDLCTLLQELEMRLHAEFVPHPSPSRATLLTLTHAYEGLLQLQQHLHELWTSGQVPDTRWLASWRPPRVCLDTLETHVRVVKERLSRVTRLLEMPPPSPPSESRFPTTPSQPIAIPQKNPPPSTVSPARTSGVETTAFSASPNFVYTEILLEEVEGGIVTDYWGRES